MTYNPLVMSPYSTPANARKGYNNTGSAIAKAVPIKVDAAGNIAPINPSLEGDVLALAGLTKELVFHGNIGDIVTSGTIENVSITGASFGDSVYVSKTGGLTINKPSIGAYGFVAGDWVIKVGVLAKNATNPALYDLIVNIHIFGQL